MGRMHDGELDIDARLVRNLLERQHPAWAHLPLQRVPSSGTDNALFRLGPSMVVRMPRIEWAVDAVSLEFEWLPRLAPHLPLDIPRPRSLGEPGAGYPWPWAIYEWLDGEDARGGIADVIQAAGDIADFLMALRTIDTAGAPVPEPGRRGNSLRFVDEQTRRSLAACAGLIDAAAGATAWEEALAAPEWDGPGMWFHGDVAGGNLLVSEGRLSAVIDFALMGVGDPACDLAVAWELLDSPARGVFRSAVGADDASWARGRGWALCTALWALPYYLDTNPVMVAQSRRKVAAVLGDHE